MKKEVIKMTAKQLIISGTGFSILGYCGAVDIQKITLTAFVSLTVKTLIVCFALLYILEHIRNALRKSVKKNSRNG